MNDLTFPAGFRFGAATSAYQIEGGWDADGKGPSIWDQFTDRRGKIDSGHHGNVAANTYHDFNTDIAIMRTLGLNAYRFSVSWPRVLPEGRGPANEAGLDYYDRLVDSLLEVGIEPFLTLFHWDLPLALQQALGGFRSRDCAYLFAEYAGVVAARLGDRVTNWITLNEPWVHATLGYLRGMHAPGEHNPRAYLRVVHHLLLGHGLAAARIRSTSPGAQVGLSLNLSAMHAARQTEGDRAAADLADQFVNGMYLESLFNGRYPPELWHKLRFFQPRIEPGDMQIISQPLDFLGINYYTRMVMQHAWYVPFIHARPTTMAGLTATGFSGRGAGYTEMGWEVYPRGLHELLLRIRDDYGNLPVYITENGAAYADEVVDGRVHDTKRQHYFEQHLRSVAAAMDEGAAVRGYFAWSLIDNFEWSYGYNKRFGLVYVDFDTQQRFIKDSGYWYRDLIAANSHSGH